MIFLGFILPADLFDIFKYLSPTILLSARKNIYFWKGDLCQNVPWSIGCLTEWWNLLGLIRQSDVSDAFNLLTVLYKLDTASYRDCVHISCCYQKGVPQDLYQQVIYSFCSLCLLGGLPSICKFLYSAWAQLFSRITLGWKFCNLVFD